MNYNPRNQKPENRLFVISILLMVCSFLVLFQVTVKVRAAEKDDDFYKYVDIFTEVYSEIKNKYVEDVDTKQLFEGAIQGMFWTLDTHSQFLGPDSLSQLEKDTGGEFSGIGIHITLKDGVLTVVAPIPGTPAAKLGIKSWDRIIEIEGESTEGITLIDAVKKLTGPEGTTVNITIYRKGDSEPLNYTITRANIKINSIYYKLLDDNTGYIRMTRFSEKTADDMKKAILDLRKQDATCLVIDLRFNTGGLLTEVVTISDYFVPKGEIIVSTKGRVISQNREFIAEEDPISELPLVVLVNRGSASASEILTGAIQDHKLGVIIGPRGENTFGKGSVQTIEELEHTVNWDDNNNPEKCAIRLTTARYYTPNGTLIDKVGITPDIGIELPEDNQSELARRGLLGDPDMNEPAIRKNKPAADDKPSTGTLSKFYLKDKKKEETEEFTDVQLNEAIKIVRAYLLMSHANGKK